MVIFMLVLSIEQSVICVQAGVEQSSGDGYRPNVSDMNMDCVSE